MSPTQSPFYVTRGTLTSDALRYSVTAMPTPSKCWCGAMARWCSINACGLSATSIMTGTANVQADVPWADLVG